MTRASIPSLLKIPTSPNPNMNSPWSRKGTLAISSAVSALLAVAPSPAPAGVFLWTGGGGDNNWSTGANWLDPNQMANQPPANTTDTAVEFDGATRLTNNQDIANKLSLNGITFDKNAGTGLVGFNLTGMPVSLVADAGNNPNLTDNTTRSPSNTISMDMEFANPTTIKGNGSANLVLSGALGGTSGFTLDSSSFTLSLSGSKVNGYGGTTTVNAGTLVLSKTANGVTAIPNDLVIGNGSATAAVTTKSFSRQIGSGSNVTINTNGTLTLSTSPAANTSLTEQIATLSGSGNVNLGAGTGGMGNPGRNTLYTGGQGKRFAI